MKQQDLVSMVVTKELQAALPSLIQQIRDQLPGLLSLEAEERRSLQMMGPRSENFGRLSLVSAKQNMQLMPRGLDIDAAFQDLEARDNLIPVLKALAQLAEELDDTIAALGSDIMVVANFAYGLMKAHGGGAGLDDAVREMGQRHRKRSRKADTPASEAGA